MVLLRWMRCRAKLCCMAFCGVIVFLVASIAVYGHHQYKKQQCNDVESKQIIDDMCELYRNRQVAGSMCSSLCESKHFHYNSCTNYKKGKKVLFLTCDSCVPGKSAVPVVLKMKTELDQRAVFDMSHEGLDTEESQQEYIEQVEQLVKNTFMYQLHRNRSKQTDIMSFAWGWDFHKYVQSNGKYNKNAIILAVDSVWSLTEQHEYLFYRHLYNYSIIPWMYGTCGPAYFVENTQTLSKYEFEMFKGWTHSWNERASIALKMIDLVNQLDKMDQTFHLCDVKLDNFGIRENGEVTLIDIDCAMFEKNLQDQFKYSNCSTHEDCHFFDCRGFCDAKSKQCLLKRTNDNMQSVCEKVFVGYFRKLPTGLLRDPPDAIKVELFNLLQECSNPVEEIERHVAFHIPRPETVTALQELLLRSLDKH